MRYVLQKIFIHDEQHRHYGTVIKRNNTKRQTPAKTQKRYRTTTHERLAYELSIAAERDLAACMATSFEEGEEKGIAKGITEGMRKIILNMKQAGMDLATIAKTAGLPEKEVEALLK